MNPKSVNDLDPKLKAAYDRIMGSSFTPGQTTQPQTPPPPQPPVQQAPVQQNPVAQTPPPTTSTDQNMPIMQTQVYTPEVAAPAPIETTSQPAPTLGSSLFTSSPSSSPQIKKKGLNVMAVLLFVGGIIFFIGYIIACAKIFGLI